MSRCGIALVLWLSGCSARELTPEEQLVGVWAVALDDNCATGIAFRGDGTYQERFGCTRDGVNVDVEVNAGHYDLTAGRLSLFVTASSCDEETARERATQGTFRVVIDDDELALHSSNASIVYVRGTTDDDDPAGAVLRYGCFVSGVFERGALSAF